MAIEPSLYFLRLPFGFSYLLSPKTFFGRSDRYVKVQRTRFIELDKYSCEFSLRQCFLQEKYLWAKVTKNLNWLERPVYFDQNISISIEVNRYKFGTRKITG